MKIYIDSEYKCHAESGDGLTPIETEFFDGKCPEYIKGYRFVPAGMTWEAENGATYFGEMIAPWRPWEALDEAQRAYEQERYDNLIAELSEVYEGA